jgi:hypothetical protein
MCIRFACHKCVSSHFLSSRVKQTREPWPRVSGRSVILCLRAKISVRSSSLAFPRLGSDLPRAFRRMESISSKVIRQKVAYVYRKSLLTSERDLSRRRRGTLRTRWLAARRRRWRGSSCQARCVEPALFKLSKIIWDVTPKSTNFAFFIASCIARISNERDCVVQLDVDQN